MICIIMLKKKKDIIYVFLENWMDISYLKLNSLYPMMLRHWRIQEFFNRGGGVPARYNFLDLEIDLMPLQTYLVLLKWE